MSGPLTKYRLLVVESNHISCQVPEGRKTVARGETPGMKQKKISRPEGAAEQPDYALDSYIAPLSRGFQCEEA